MHLLVRHGETVDNVAGLYAGSRDSSLTTHGVLQTRRLASHLASTLAVKHLFSSNLRRAIDTAEAVREAQLRRDDALKVVQVPELREKDFGSGEGARFGKGMAHVGAETHESMRLRIDRFLDDHLLPLMDDNDGADDSACVVVAHGIILGVLFKALCSRVSASAITVSAEAAGLGVVQPSWSNTGYLEATLNKPKPTPSSPTTDASSKGKCQPSSILSYKLDITTINHTNHLQGLKKTRGGIGSAKFDNKQKTMDSFFQPASRKRKLEGEGRDDGK